MTETTRRSRGSARAPSGSARTPPRGCFCRLEAGAKYLRAVPDLTREDVIDLCERALRIDITLGEVERLWPDHPQDTELAAIREDLLFGLEHVPGSRRHPDGDPERWRQMPEYDDIERHLRRLRAG